MSSFNRPSGTPGPGSIGLVQLAPPAPPLDPAYLLFTGGVWTYASPPAGAARRTLLTFTRNAVVPGGSAMLALEYGDQMEATDLGLKLPSAATLIGIAVIVEVIDAARTFEIRVEKNGPGAPVTLGTLGLALSTLTNTRRDLLVPIVAGDTIAVRMFRLTGPSSNSSFNRIGVAVELELP